MLAGRARRRQRELAEVWPEAVDNLASRRAGRACRCPRRSPSSADRGPEPLREPFVAFGVDYQVTGRFADSLDRLKVRLADPVGDRVVEGLRIAREVGGGDLGRLLRNLSGFLRDDARTRSELESRQAWTVNGARLAVAAPWLVLLLLCFQREVIARYASPSGVVVLAVGAATVRWSPTARWSGSAGCPRNAGCCRDAGGMGCAVRRRAGLWGWSLVVTRVAGAAAPRLRGPGAAVRP